MGGELDCCTVDHFIGSGNRYLDGNGPTPEIRQGSPRDFSYDKSDFWCYVNLLAGRRNALSCRDPQYLGARAGDRVHRERHGEAAVAGRIMSGGDESLEKAVVELTRVDDVLGELTHGEEETGGDR